MISRTRSRIATSNPSRREPSWPTSLTMLAFAMAYSSCALNLQSRDSGLSPLLTSQENTPSLFLQESGRSPFHRVRSGRPVQDRIIAKAGANASDPRGRPDPVEKSLYLHQARGLDFCKQALSGPKTILGTGDLA